MSKSSFEDLNKLYRTLLAPITFLILISWSYLTQMVNLSMQYPDKVTFTMDLNVPLQEILFTLTCLAISLIFYMPTYFEKERNLIWFLKGVGFASLFAILFYCTIPVFFALILIVLGLPEAPSISGLIFPIAIISLSVLLTILLFWRFRIHGTSIS